MYTRAKVLYLLCEHILYLHILDNGWAIGAFHFVFKLLQDSSLLSKQSHYQVHCTMCMHIIYHCVW